MDQKTKHEHNDYSTLEVDESVNLPQVKYDNVLPEVKPSHEPPQALPSHEDFPEVVRNGRKNATLCGLRRKAFWTTLLVVVLIIAIAIGVGVGVGVTRRSNSPSAKSSAGESGGANDGSNNGSSTNTSQPGYLASFSRLAAANYTDSQDRERALVYYQDNSLDIWKAERASSSTAWSRELVNMSGINPERGTPLTAFCLPETSVSVSTKQFHVSRSLIQKHLHRSPFSISISLTRAPTVSGPFSMRAPAGCRPAPVTTHGRRRTAQVLPCTPTNARTTPRAGTKRHF